MSDREALAMPSFDDMDDFAPRSAAAAPKPAGQGTATEVATPSPAAVTQQPSAPVVTGPVSRAADTKRAIDAVSRFPSREASTDGQMNLKGPRHVLDRFRAMCKDDRRAYYDMLEILMNSYEAKT